MNRPMRVSLISLIAVIALTACGKSEPPPATVVVTTPRPAPSEVNVTMNVIDVNGVGAPIGTVTMHDSAAGLAFTPNLTGLPSGLHGFHIHENPDCSAKEKDGKLTAGEAAGSHYDPMNTGKHAGPDGAGHAGDLPKLQVSAQGLAITPVTMARLRLAQVRNRALVIHADDDNYSDSPGGERIACGVIR